MIAIWQKSVLRIFPILVLLHLTATVQANSYLSELEAEANSTEGGTTAPAQESTWSHSKQRLSKTLKKGLDQKQFTQALRDNYYGSYVFYDRLNEWNKQQVYKVYQDTNDIELVRTEIKKRMTK